MSAVIMNSLGIIIGSILGLLFRKSINPSILDKVQESLGYCIVVIGLKSSFEYQNIFIILFSTSLGTAIGFWLNLEDRILSLKEKIGASKKSFISEGFISSSLIFCIGSMAIIGPINAALGNHEILKAKTMIDTVLSIIFSATYGFSVAFSAIPVFLYEGLINFSAGNLKFLNESILKDLSSVAGILLFMIGLNLTKIKIIPVINFLPSLFILFFLICI